MSPRTFSSIAFALCIALVTSVASAQSAEDKAAAEALFDEGKRLFLEKRFADACPKFEASQKLDPGGGTLLYLADCYEGAGKLASAWATFREAASLAKNAGNAERERVARTRAGMLEAKLFRVSVKLEGALPKGLIVSRNGTEMKGELLNVPLPVDAGKLVIEVRAQGKKTFKTTVEIPNGPGDKVIEIPALVDEPAPAQTPTEPPAQQRAPEPPPAPEPYWSGQRIAGISVGAAGVALMGVGSIFAAQAFSKNDEAKTLCEGTVCKNQQGVDALQGARTAADISTGLFLAGGAAVLGGVIVFFTAPSAKKTARPIAPLSTMARMTATPIVGPRFTGASIGGSF